MLRAGSRLFVYLLRAWIELRCFFWDAQMVRDLGVPFRRLISATLSYRAMLKAIGECAERPTYLREGCDCARIMHETWMREYVPLPGPSYRIVR